MEYTQFEEKWKEILQRMEKTGGMTREVAIEPPATLSEVEQVERKMGFRLPASFREALLNYSRKVDLYYSFPNSVHMPSKFKSIFCGGISWNLNELVSLEEWIDDNEEEEYAARMRGKIGFFDVGNGDYITFQKTQEEDSPIVYWNHEGEEDILLASNFEEFLNKVMDLNGVGPESWQYEPFLTEKGLVTNSMVALEWKIWFEFFTTVELKDIEDNLPLILYYIQTHGEIGEEEEQALSKFPKEELSEAVYKALNESEDHSRRPLYEIISTILKEETPE